MNREEMFYLFIIFIFITLVSQNFISILLSTELNIKYIILFKDLYLLFLSILGLLIVLSKKEYRILKSLKAYSLEIAVFAFFMCAIIYLFLPIGINSFFTKTIAFRQLMIIIVFYFIGRFYSHLNLKLLNKILTYIGIIVAIFGFIEYFFLGDKFWIELNIYQYMKQKGMEVWAYAEGGLPGNFYTYDFINFLDQPIRRNVTLLAEPTLSGHFFSYLVVYNMFYKNFFLAWIFLISLILTFSKGGIGVVILSIFLIMLKKVSKWKRLIIISIFFMILVLISFLMYNTSQSVKNHIHGLVYNTYLVLKNPIGYGLGTSGNFSKLFSHDFLGAGESYFGAIIGQMGILGGFLYLLIIKNIFSLLFESKEKLYNIIYAVSLSTLLVGLFSESAISYVGSGYIFFLLGIVRGKYINNLRRCAIKRRKSNG